MAAAVWPKIMIFTETKETISLLDMCPKKDYDVNIYGTDPTKYDYYKCNVVPPIKNDDKTSVAINNFGNNYVRIYGKHISGKYVTGGNLDMQKLYDLVKDEERYNYAIIYANKWFFITFEYPEPDPEKEFKYTLKFPKELSDGDFTNEIQNALNEAHDNTVFDSPIGRQKLRLVTKLRFGTLDQYLYVYMVSDQAAYSTGGRRERHKNKPILGFCNGGEGVMTVNNDGRPINEPEPIVPLAFDARRCVNLLYYEYTTNPASIFGSPTLILK